jgi:hypothetical protein
MINLRDLAPCGLVAVASGPPIPLSGSTPTAPIFEVAGYSFVAGR